MTAAQSDVNGTTAFRPGIRVAVIGAGISGVCSAAHLIVLGANVTVFERSSVVGGVWHYDERKSLDPEYLNLPTTNKDENLNLVFAPPGPCYAGLQTNVPTSLMASSLTSWPPGTGEVVSHQDAESYIQRMARDNGVHARTQYNTRVEHIKKTSEECLWAVSTVRMRKPFAQAKLARETAYFDAIVIASGHYDMPRFPDIEGLRPWKLLFSQRVTHSKQYRKPCDFEDKNVLVIGGGNSSTDICRELDGISRRVYQSVRGGQFDQAASMLPKGVMRIGEVLQFTLDVDSEKGCSSDEESIPGKVLLRDGSVLTKIHHVILATGYYIHYPFLSHLQSENMPSACADSEVLVTSGAMMVHNLYKDIFYTQDPSLAFVGVPYHVATFSLFDFQAQAVARTFCGYAAFPTPGQMRTEYLDRIRRKGEGRSFHSLMEDGAEITYVEDLVAWMNASSRTGTISPMKGHTKEWVASYWNSRAKHRQ